MLTLICHLGSKTTGVLIDIFKYSKSALKTEDNRPPFLSFFLLPSLLPIFPSFFPLFFPYWEKETKIYIHVSRRNKIQCPAIHMKRVDSR